MQTMWAGRFQKQLDAEVNDFNSSISYDARMFRQDICLLYTSDAADE